MSSGIVIPLDVVRQVYQAEAENFDGEECFPGFSERLNHLIDLTQGLDIPALQHRGRLAYVAKITGHSKPAVADWLKKNKPPRDDTLRSLVSFFLHHIDGNYNTLRVESWLRYGEEATSNPFTSARQEESDDTALRPLAFGLIAEAGRRMDLTVASYELQAVLEDTLIMLKDYGVNGSADIQEPMTDLVSYYIQQHPRR